MLDHGPVSQFGSYLGHRKGDTVETFVAARFSRYHPQTIERLFELGPVGTGSERFEHFCQRRNHIVCHRGPLPKVRWQDHRDMARVQARERLVNRSVKDAGCCRLLAREISNDCATFGHKYSV